MRVPWHLPASIPGLTHRALCLALHSRPAGYLVAIDSYMNVQLSSTEEWSKGAARGTLGDVLIRCNNVLYMRKA